MPDFSAEVSAQPDCSQVLAALARVDEIYQAAVALFYLEENSYKDIAAILEVPLGTVKSRIARGIEQLRKILLPKVRGGSLFHGDEIFFIVNTDKPAAKPETTQVRPPFYLREWPKQTSA